MFYSWQQQGSAFLKILHSPSLLEISCYFRAEISACRLASILFISSTSRPRGRYRFPSLDYLPGGVAFGLFDPFRISSLGYEYGTTAQAAAVFVHHKTRLITFVAFFVFRLSFFFTAAAVYETMISSLLLH